MQPKYQTKMDLFFFYQIIKMKTKQQFEFSIRFTIIFNKMKRKKRKIRIDAYTPKSLSSSATTGFSVYFSFGTPLGRPKWLISTMLLAPFSRACFTVGMAATILKRKRKEIHSYSFVS